MGLYLLNKLQKYFPKEDIGLYRDEGLAVDNLSGPQMDCLKGVRVSIRSSDGLIKGSACEYQDIQRFWTEGYN